MQDVQVPRDWVDYNGHMNDSRYMQLSSETGDRFLRLRFAALAIGSAKAAAVAVVELLEDQAVVHPQRGAGHQAGGGVLRAGQRRGAQAEQRRAGNEREWVHGHVNQRAARAAMS